MLWRLERKAEPDDYHDMSQKNKPMTWSLRSLSEQGGLLISDQYMRELRITTHVVDWGG